MGRILKADNFKKTIYYLKRNGLKRTYYAARERVEGKNIPPYTYQPVTDEELRRQKEKSSDFSIKFSILVPAYETKETYLRDMIESVLNQSYGKFELIIADAGASDTVEKTVRSYEDGRIMYRRLKTNGGISGNTNQGLMYATGDYAGLLDHDDLLTPDALYEMAALIEENRKKDIELQLLYSDEDKCSSDASSYYEVNKKPKFNLDLFFSNNYICHFMVMKRQLMQELQFRSICDGAQDFDIALRAVNRMLGKDKKGKKAQELPIAHIPKVLYHWRCHEDSTAANPESKRYAYDAGKRAVEDFLRARQWKGKVSHTGHLGFYRIDYEPDLLANRPDTALIGGRLLDRKNRVAGGIYTEEGNPLYTGLHKEYSGYMNRAHLQQEASAIDVRCMMASPEAEAVMEKITGLPYLKNPKTGRFDWRGAFKEDADFVEISKNFCKEVRKLGMRIVWDPAMCEKIDRE